MRAPGLKQKGEMIDKEPELKENPYEEGSLLANEDVKMSEVYSAVLSVDVSLVPCQWKHVWNLINAGANASVEI